MEMKGVAKQYGDLPLKREDLSKSPFDQFLLWFEEALDAEVVEPNAIALATTTAGGKPSCRMVLLKHFDVEGAVFFTNYESRKSAELEENPYAAITLFWHELSRQVCMEGRVEKISPEESMTYFVKRPRESQIGAWASRQDTVIPSRSVLDEEYARLQRFYGERSIPLPPFWGGFRLVPDRFEFWQGRSRRLHDRFQYILQDSDWRIDRLSP